jgi:tetratricopeptide (TPR) repeat protein
VWGLLLASVLLAASALALAGRSGPGLPPVHAADRWTTAREAYADRDLARAEALLRELLRDPSDRRDVRLLLGRTLVERGRTTEARQIFSALASAQADPDALRGLGAVSESERQYEAAASFYRRAAELKKDDPTIRRDLARAQAARGDALGALASLQESLRLDPGQTDLLALQSELAAGARTPPRGPNVPRPPDVPGRTADAAPLSGPRVPDPARAFPKPDNRMR